MRGIWPALIRIPLRYTAVALFCLAVAVSLSFLGREGLGAVLPAAVVTAVVTAVLGVAGRGRRRTRPAVVAPPPAPRAPQGRPAAAAARVGSAWMAGPIQSAFAAEPGWRAIFGDGPDRTMSRLVGWAVTTSDDGATEVVGLIADPGDPARIVPAAGVVTPEGQTLTRYGFKEA